jgi:hypothetical protein
MINVGEKKFKNFLIDIGIKVLILWKIWDYRHEFTYFSEIQYLNEDNLYYATDYNLSIKS